MNKLKYEVKTVREIDYKDLNEFVTNYYDLKEPYTVTSNEEWGNDQSHHFTLKKHILMEYQLEKLKEFQLGKNQMFMLHTIFQDLVNNNAIEEGEYSVNVCW